ncbi:MAG TPA: sialidase family protein [Bryobacteraceae bacterium]|nr:sialidase family protein [Bryobacteraceae bacterium]
MSRVAILLALCVLHRPAVAAEPLFEQTEVFVGGQDAINTYRIPSLIATDQGTVLAFCEGRRDSSQDGSPTHLVLKRSIGNIGDWNPSSRPGPVPRSREQNMMWQPMQVLRASKAAEAYMNPVPVIDQRSGTIYLLVNHYAQYDPQADAFGGRGQIWLMQSNDEGAKWSEPADLTPAVGNKELGPGVGVQMVMGRLVVPVYDGVIYSDDHGKTWQAGGKAPPSLNETQVVELADGSLMLNVRGAPRRTVVVSRDGGVTWGEPKADPVLTDSELWGGCQASLFRYSRAVNGNGRNRLLFANPADLKHRYDLTVRLSYDEGKTWPVAKLVQKGPGAYSSMTVFPDGTIGIIFETGNSYNGRVEYCAKLTLARFNLEWLTDGTDMLLR